MREQQIQSKLINQLRIGGYFVIKLVTTNINGIPDMLAIKNGKIMFVEVKQKGQKPRKLQLYWLRKLKEYGCQCYWYDGEFHEI